MFRICIQIFWLANISIKCAMVIAVEIELDWSGAKLALLTLQMFINEAMKCVEYIYMYAELCRVRVRVRLDGRGEHDVTIKWWMYCRKCDTSIQWVSVPVRLRYSSLHLNVQWQYN